MNSIQAPRLGYKSSMDMTCKNYVNDNSSATLKSTQPPEPGHKSSIDMIFKKGQKCEKTLNNTRPLGPGHKSSMDMICKYNVNDNFFSISCEKKVNNNF